MNIDEKVRTLKAAIHACKKLVIAFSGGVDSTVIAALAQRTLGENAVAVTIVSEVLSATELECAKAIAKELGIQHILIQHTALANETFSSNPNDRCYHCKGEHARRIRAYADQHGIEYVAYGVTRSDFDEHRPGIQAVREEGGWLPFVEAGLTKTEVRAIALELDLRVHDKPSQACLASRIPYGETITTKKLEAIAKSEAVLQSYGFRQVRVRHHGNIARIEVEPGELDKLIQEPVRTEIVEKLRLLGFAYVTVDLAGYRSGSMDEVIDEHD